MKLHQRPLQAAVAGLFVLGMAGTAFAQNPCAPKAKNPCAAKANPCAAASKVDPKLVTRPKGTKLTTGNRAEMLKLGKALWNDTKLSTNNMSCNTCHQGGAAFQASFAKPYPHTVAMAKERGGIKRINLDEMNQFCLIVPMAGKTLGWESKELAALTAYTAQVQKSFKPSGARKANPCAAKNPCAPATNPCAPKKK